MALTLPETRGWVFRRGRREDPAVPSGGDPRLALAGAELLALIRDWPGWTHRRVEHVTFLEEDLVRRRIVDLTVPERAPQAWNARLVPLGLLRKGRLAQFDLRREGGEAVPLLTSAQNGPLSTEVLVAAAGLVVGEAGPVPDGLRGSLATIAAGDGAAAVEAWRGLGVADDEEDGWREILAADGWFMELALNLAHNFLVVASVEAESGERRVLKMSYVRRLGAEAPSPRVAGVYAVRAEAAASARLAVSATVAVPGAARPRPLPRVTFRVVAVESGRTVAWLATDGEGAAEAWLAPGRHRVEVIDAPAGTALQRPVEEAELAAGGRVEVVLAFEPTAGACHAPPCARVVAPRALAPNRLAVPVPGLRFCASAHLEIEAPEGLRVTRAALHEFQRPTGPARPRRSGARRRRGGVGAARAPVPSPGPATTGRAASSGRAHGRARSSRRRRSWPPSRPCCWRSWPAPGSPDRDGRSTGSLLLFVPGLASAYIARPRGPVFTSRTCPPCAPGRSSRARLPDRGGDVAARAHDPHRPQHARDRRADRRRPAAADPRGGARVRQPDRAGTTWRAAVSPRIAPPPALSQCDQAMPSKPRRRSPACSASCWTPTRSTGPRRRSRRAPRAVRPKG